MKKYIYIIIYHPATVKALLGFQEVLRSKYNNAIKIGDDAYLLQTSLEIDNLKVDFKSFMGAMFITQVNGRFVTRGYADYVDQWLQEIPSVQKSFAIPTFD